jgi:hypothetical protein
MTVLDLVRPGTRRPSASVETARLTWVRTGGGRPWTVALSFVVGTVIGLAATAAGLFLAWPVLVPEVAQPTLAEAAANPLTLILGAVVGVASAIVTAARIEHRTG